MGLSFTYDENGRLIQATQTNNPLGGGVSTYDARSRLASRTITHAAAPPSTITYIHDIRDHIIAETDANGVTQREYIWLDDLPVAVVDQVATSPVIYYVHTDHLFRPLGMTDANWNIVWSVIYKPFGAVATSNAPTTPLDMRFPGQWFQLETGLHYNWHRHYDPTMGRYLQPDPLGLQALLSDGPSVYNYAGESPLVRTDPDGQFTNPLEGACLAGPNPVCAAGAASDILTTLAGLYLIAQPPGPSDLIVDKIGNVCKRDHDDECDKLHEIDTSTCNAITRRRGKTAGAICHASAAERYAECLRDGISGVKTPLSTWNN